MQVPLEISYRDVKHTEELEALLRERADKLHRINERIVSCRIALEKPHASPRSGSPYRVRLELRVPPGHDLVVTRDPGDGEPHEPLPTVIRHAFDVLERRLRKVTDKSADTAQLGNKPGARQTSDATDAGTPPPDRR